MRVNQTLIHDFYKRFVIFSILFICHREISASPRQVDTKSKNKKPTESAEYHRIFSSRPIPNNGPHYIISSVDQTQMQDDSSGLTLNYKNDEQYPKQPSKNLLQRFENSGILQSLLKMFTSVNAVMPQPIETSQSISPMTNLFDNKFSNANRQFDDPIRTIEYLSSIDAKPISESSKFGEDWKKTLLGPGGILTEIFNLVNQKRKDEEKTAKVQHSKTQNDPTDQPSTLGPDFSRIIDAFISKSNGNFDEPLPEIPFLGICDRLSCGDIYKAFDEFRKSELFSNFQTAISLLHDQKGWDIIGEVLANPELIENFTGQSNFEELISPNLKKTHQTSGVNSAKTAHNGRDIKAIDGDLGVDFSSLIDETVINKEKKESLPEILENVDYYSSVDRPEESIIEEKVFATPKSEVNVIKNAIIEKPKTNIQYVSNSYQLKPLNKTYQISSADIMMPEISESIDEFSNGVDHVNVIVEERVKKPAPRALLTTKSVPLKVTTMNGVDRQLPIIFKKLFTDEHTNRPPTVAHHFLNISITQKPYTKALSMTTQRSVRITKNNFRKNNDYYSMYYDDG